MRKGEDLNIVLKKLAVGYEQPDSDPSLILKNINFTASHGEMVALIGSNGIGKSTLLRTVAGFQPWFEGSIEIGSRNLESLSLRERSRIISFVSTEKVNVPNLLVYDLVAYGRFPYTNRFGTLSDLDKSIINDALNKVGLNGMERREVMHISDGERQRAMIARALAQDTPVIVLDEPTAFLDVSNKYEIFHLLQLLAYEKGKTIVLSTHDLNIALREVDKLWVVTDSGNFEGAPEDSVLKGWLNRLFVGRNVDFDANEGEFFFRKDFKAKVKVTGSGLQLIWTLRALNRKGYQIVMNVDPDFIVDAYDNRWILENRKGKKEFSSIYELLSSLN